MNGRSKIELQIFAIMFFVLGLLFLTIAGNYNMMRKDVEKNGVEIEAQVTSTVEVHSGEVNVSDSCSVYFTNYKQFLKSYVSYTYDGIEYIDIYSGYTVDDTGDVGSTTKIVIDKNNPGTIMAKTTIPTFLFLLAIGCGGAFAGIGLFIYSILKANKEDVYAEGL